LKWARLCNGHHRDDFDRSRGRQTCYEAILALEPKLRTLIARINKAGKKKTLVTLENVVSEAVARGQRGKTGQRRDRHAAGINPGEGGNGGRTPAAAPEIAAPPEPAPSASPMATPAYAVRFAAPPAQSAEFGRRSYREGETIVINPEHPDFKERLAYTRQGQPRITDRLNAYLAGVISLSYPEQFTAPSVDTGAAFEAQLDFMLKLEATLRKQQAALER
jgi:hypothetical protein